MEFVAQHPDREISEYFRGKFNDPKYKERVRSRCYAMVQKLMNKKRCRRKNKAEAKGLDIEVGHDVAEEEQKQLQILPQFHHEFKLAEMEVSNVQVEQPQVSLDKIMLDPSSKHSDIQSQAVQTLNAVVNSCDTVSEKLSDQSHVDQNDVVIEFEQDMHNSFLPPPPGTIENLPLKASQSAPTQVTQSKPLMQDASTQSTIYSISTRNAVKELYYLAKSFNVQAFNHQIMKNKTRMQEKGAKLTSKDYGIDPKSKVQFGYGEATEGTIEKLISILQSSEKLQELVDIPDINSYILNKDSVFLDIGSGIGQVVLHVALRVGCRSFGMEANLNRNQLAEQLCASIALHQDVPPNFLSRLSFLKCDASEKQTNFFQFGRCPSHVFSFNVVFSEENVVDIFSILNQLDFKVLVVNNNPKEVLKMGLANVICVNEFECRLIGGKGKYKSYVYIKQSQNRITSDDELRILSKTVAQKPIFKLTDNSNVEVERKPTVEVVDLPKKEEEKKPITEVKDLTQEDEKKSQISNTQGSELRKRVIYEEEEKVPKGKSGSQDTALYKKLRYTDIGNFLLIQSSDPYSDYKLFWPLDSRVADYKKLIIKLKVLLKDDDILKNPTLSKASLFMVTPMLSGALAFMLAAKVKCKVQCRLRDLEPCILDVYASILEQLSSLSSDNKWANLISISDKDHEGQSPSHLFISLPDHQQSSIEQYLHPITQFRYAVLVINAPLDFLKTSGAIKDLATNLKQVDTWDTYARGQNQTFYIYLRYNTTNDLEYIEWVKNGGRRKLNIQIDVRNTFKTLQLEPLELINKSEKSSTITFLCRPSNPKNKLAPLQVIKFFYRDYEVDDFLQICTNAILIKNQSIIWSLRSSFVDCVNERFDVLFSQTDFHPCSLDQMLSNLDNKHFKMVTVAAYFGVILHTYSTMKLINLVHGDLDSRNILINQDLCPVFTGFAQSYFLDKRDFSNPNAVLPIGSIDVRAPEVAKYDRDGTKYDPVKADIWSLGVILYGLMYQCLPYTEEDLAKDQIDALELPKRPGDSHIISMFSQLLVQILNPDPAQRPTSSQIYKHPAVNHFKPMLKEYFENKRRFRTLIHESDVQRISRFVQGKRKQFSQIQDSDYYFKPRQLQNILW